MDAIGWSHLCNGIVSLVVWTIGHLVIIISRMRNPQSWEKLQKKRAPRKLHILKCVELFVSRVWSFIYLQTADTGVTIFPSPANSSEWGRLARREGGPAKLGEETEIQGVQIDVAWGMGLLQGLLGPIEVTKGFLGTARAGVNYC